MSAADIERAQTAIFASLIELDKTEPAAVDRIVTSICAHLQSWRPMSVSPLGTLPPPTDPAAIRDPREVR